MLAVLPANERSFLEEMRNFNFPEARSLKLMEVMGFDKRRLVAPGVCISDLAVFGLQHLFDRGLLKPEDISALLVVSQTPDYLMPPTSNVIQGRLKLSQDMFLMDISQACAGFVVGLIEAFMLLQQESIQKVVLINGEVLSRKASPQDRNIYPLVGDAVTITVLERDPAGEEIFAAVKSDGTRREALMIPAGGMRLPCSPETAALRPADEHNLRSQEHLHMDGAAIFNFVQTEVPPLIEGLLARANRAKDSVEYFLCHQPNRFMLQKLADKMKVPRERMPNNVVERFGNSSGATIPIAVTLNLAQQAKTGSLRVCIAGFGAGLTWAAMLLTLGKLAFCEQVDYP
ncbi:MAG TPA: ketoacyl-ACP synthase III [Verrucomicrobiae bacterium]|nr:ketoacyl-ACP synthase III [Verrucomicrobiae bacterium]